MKRSIVLIVLIFIITSGCGESTTKEVSLNYLNFLKSSEQLTIHDYNAPQPANPYLITQKTNKIEKLISSITHQKGKLVDNAKSSLLSDNIYLIKFDHATRENGKSINLRVVYDLDKNLLLLPSKYQFESNKNSKEPKHVLANATENFKRTAVDALQRAETTLTKQELKERKELLESVK
ncbi:MAG: hypothetical protein K9L17_13365 [Clostridiales bacterium]|nr:hypothetical protein [Clostridiales bacterium]MCF8023664.1 hypothetical protein [Clostridiales bacterium]